MRKPSAPHRTVPDHGTAPDPPRSREQAILDTRHRKIVDIAEYLRKCAIESAIEMLRTAPQAKWDQYSARLGHRTVSQITKDGVLAALEKAKKKGRIK